MRLALVRCVQAAVWISFGLLDGVLAGLQHRAESLRFAMLGPEETK